MHIFLVGPGTATKTVTSRNNKLRARSPFLHVSFGSPYKIIAKILIKSIKPTSVNTTTRTACFQILMPLDMGVRRITRKSSAQNRSDEIFVTVAVAFGIAASLYTFAMKNVKYAADCDRNYNYSSRK